MKIYFTAAISGVSLEDKQRYLKIIGILESNGLPVLAEHIRGKWEKEMESIDVESEEFVALSQQIVKAKMQADVVVCEVSHPSFRVGQEITYSLSQGKPVIALYLKGIPKPRILRGIHTDRIFLVEYTVATLSDILMDYIDYAKQTADTRFNFFVSPKQQHYLEWVSNHRKVARAVFLRQLIEKSMDSDHDYQKEK